jgi:hypothetical protein
MTPPNECSNQGMERDLPQSTRDWIQAEADKHFGGDWVAAAAAILEAAHAAEQAPEDPWAGLNSRIRSRTR